MPGFDKTGPLGQGPMTGGGFGLCGRNNQVGETAGRGSRGAGRGGQPRGGGRGRAWGGGRGRKHQPDRMSRELDILKKRIEQLESGQPDR